MIAGCRLGWIGWIGWPHFPERLARVRARARVRVSRNRIHPIHPIHPNRSKKHYPPRKTAAETLRILKGRKADRWPPERRAGGQARADAAS